MKRLFLLLTAAACLAQSGGELLYNGIRLPAEWPPRVASISNDPSATPAYLTSPPAVIPIDVGRQLFVDDFLIESTTLQRTFHSAKYHPASPVLKPDKPWERQDTGHNAEIWGPGVAVSVYSDGVWYEPREHLFKMWYRIGYTLATALAVSPDGVHWEKRSYDVIPGTNIVHPIPRGSSTIWMDLDETDPNSRYKMVSSTSHMQPQRLYYSPDGVHWSAEVTRSLPCGDRTTFFLNPFRKMWVAGIRDSPNEEMGRVRRYYEAPNLKSALNWKEGQPVWWTAADRLDPMRDDLKVQPQLYNLDAVGYESVMLGAFSIWRGQPKDRPKPNEILLGFSRDGFHWTRPDRKAFIPVSEHYGDWNWGNVQSAGGIVDVVGDQLYFYVMGWAGVAGTVRPGTGFVGLATLRRDGFASMDAGNDGGKLTTRPIRFSGSKLFINADASQGEVRAEVLDAASGKPLPGLSMNDCLPVRENKTLEAVAWKNGKDLSAIAGLPVRIRFQLRNAHIYSFWVSTSESGASHGYVAGGGPGFEHSYDDAGISAYRAAQALQP
jgi:hypothetical protein